MAGLRYLWLYSAADSWTEGWHQELLRRRQARGHDVRHLCVTPPSLGCRWLPFPELHARWRHGDPDLMALYAAIAWAMADRDVLVLYNGANLHPEFVATLGGWKVYTAGDDPEHTTILTAPVAPAFDQHLVNNIAETGLYRSWGLREVAFWPLGSQIFPEEVADLDETALIDPGCRDVPAVFIGERNAWKASRLDRLARVVPGAVCAGWGWPGQRPDRRGLMDLYRRARIGFNLHNSTGPINFRLYDLTACGVAQVCDNGDALSPIYGPDEVVGFTTIDEGVTALAELHADVPRQRRLALAAHRRWRRDYTPDAVWDRLVDLVTTAYRARSPVDPVTIVGMLDRRGADGRLRRFQWQCLQKIRRGVGLPRRVLGRLRRTWRGT